ncbi:MAG TPA: hypothetical protein VIV58_26765, partial [Kofleriaceae bacterium]
MSRDIHHSQGVDVLAREAQIEDDIAEQTAVQQLETLREAHLMKDNLLALEMRLLRTELTKQGQQHAKV